MKLPTLRLKPVRKDAISWDDDGAGIIFSDKCTVTEWDPGIGWQDLQAQGYQREPWKKHYEAIGRFLSAEVRTLSCRPLPSSRQEKETMG